VAESDRLWHPYVGTSRTMITGPSTYQFTTALRRWTEGHGSGLHVADVPPAVAEALTATAQERQRETGRRGFGAVRLTIRIRGSEWQTSAFPIGEGNWSIALAAKVCKAEGLVAGKSVDVSLRF